MPFFGTEVAISFVRIHILFRGSNLRNVINILGVKPPESGGQTIPELGGQIGRNIQREVIQRFEFSSYYDAKKTFEAHLKWYNYTRKHGQLG